MAPSHQFGGHRNVLERSAGKRGRPTAGSSFDMIKQLNKLTILFLWFILTASAQGRVSMAGGKVSFAPPDGFRAMTEGEIKIKYPRGNAPQYVYSNDQMDVSIAIIFSPQPVTLEGLPQLKAAMEQTLPRLIPGHNWLTREIVEINGRPWVHFEMTSFAIDTDIHNEMYLTAFEGKMLGFNFNSTEAQHNRYKDALQKSRDTMRVSD